MNLNALSLWHMKILNWCTASESACPTVVVFFCTACSCAVRSSSDNSSIIVCTSYWILHKAELEFKKGRGYISQEPTFVTLHEYN